MRKVVLERQFKKDAKKNFLELVTPGWAEILNCLCQDLKLPEKYKDHALSGNWLGFRDCHVKPDLVLIYMKNGDEYVQLIRLGSHSELFG
ncbi:MAG: type II toxin-antitoxin system YafQ family toxin [Zymomonas mobilis]|uniref:mRNA interferase YafQ n=1 Tax=Zymomonas mobilis TaxID=542 RepID=A0A542VUL3_ZYMMB|nr:type II toxin-antitoxin system YafQ family toxin [Zymomonas mobilis]TQL15007.1 mRNA interferase YafQ [Zymomonas mobilis]